MNQYVTGAVIRELRENKLLTQAELAAQLHISDKTVSKWENGDTLPDTGILLDLCDILNTTADKLLNGGSLAPVERKLMRLDDVKTGFQYMESIGKLFDIFYCHTFRNQFLF